MHSVENDIAKLITTTDSKFGIFTAFNLLINEKGLNNIDVNNKDNSQESVVFDLMAEINLEQDRLQSMLSSADTEDSELIFSSYEQNQQALDGIHR